MSLFIMTWKGTFLTLHERSNDLPWQKKHGKSNQSKLSMILGKIMPTMQPLLLLELPVAGGLRLPSSLSSESCFLVLVSLLPVLLRVLLLRVLLLLLQLLPLLLLLLLLLLLPPLLLLLLLQPLPHGMTLLTPRWCFTDQTCKGGIYLMYNTMVWHEEAETSRAETGRNDSPCCARPNKRANSGTYTPTSTE